jgi:biopolymer transport protein ExbD
MQPFSKPPKRLDHESRILPLINVVFLLLIFFMVVGAINVSDPFEVTPPESASETLTSPQSLSISLSQSGQLALDGERVSRDELLTALRAKLAEQPLIAIDVKADEQLPGNHLILLMEELQQIGIDKLHLLTKLPP